MKSLDDDDELLELLDLPLLLTLELDDEEDDDEDDGATPPHSHAALHGPSRAAGRQSSMLQLLLTEDEEDDDDDDNEELGDVHGNAGGSKNKHTSSVSATAVHKHWSAEELDELVHKSLNERLSNDDVSNNSFALSEEKEYNESNELLLDEACAAANNATLDKRN